MPGPGIEPRPAAWQADVLTTTLPRPSSHVNHLSLTFMYLHVHTFSLSQSWTSIMYLHVHTSSLSRSWASITCTSMCTHPVSPGHEHRSHVPPCAHIQSLPVMNIDHMYLHVHTSSLSRSWTSITCTSMCTHPVSPGHEHRSHVPPCAHIQSLPVMNIDHMYLHVHTFSLSQSWTSITCTSMCTHSVSPGHEHRSHVPPCAHIQSLPVMNIDHMYLHVHTFSLSQSWASITWFWQHCWLENKQSLSNEFEHHH